jgi:hypothetical protein
MVQKKNVERERENRVTIHPSLHPFIPPPSPLPPLPPYYPTYDTLTWLGWALVRMYYTCASLLRCVALRLRLPAAQRRGDQLLTTKRPTATATVGDGDGMGYILASLHAYEMGDKLTS